MIQTIVAPSARRWKLMQRRHRQAGGATMRQRIFISSMQKELQAERFALQDYLAEPMFLSRYALNRQKP